jgi:hypothetical protein
MAMRKVLLAAVMLGFPAVASAQYSGSAQWNEGPFGTGNNGWCQAPPGRSCTTGRQTRHGTTPNYAPTLPGVGSAAPPAVAVIVPPLMLGLRQLLEGGAQSIALNPPGSYLPPDATAQLPGPVGQFPPGGGQAQSPPFWLIPSRYNVANRGYDGTTLIPIGSATISAISSQRSGSGAARAREYWVDKSNEARMSRVRFRISYSRQIVDPRYGTGYMYNNVQYQNILPASTSLTRLNPP